MSDTPEGVAFKLLELLMQNETQSAELKTKTPTIARLWMLNAYAECLQATTGQRPRADGGGGKGGGKGGAGRTGAGRGGASSAI